MVKKNKQQQEMEKQIQSFAGTTAGSVVISLGIAVVGIPFAVKYLVKAAEEQALPYAAMLGGTIGDAIKEFNIEQQRKFEQLKKEAWHKANPDVTQQDIDVPARSGDPYTDYLMQVGLPPSTVLVLFGDKAGLSVYQHSGEFNYYGTRNINGQTYYLVVPKGIQVYYKRSQDVFVPPDDKGKCPTGFKTITKDAQGLPLPGGIVRCGKTVTINVVIDPTGVWP